MNRQIEHFDKFISIIHPEFLPSKEAIRMTRELLKWAAEEGDLVNFEITQNNHISIENFTRGTKFTVNENGIISDKALKYIQLKFEWD